MLNLKSGSGGGGGGGGSKVVGCGWGGAGEAVVVEEGAGKAHGRERKGKMVYCRNLIFELNTSTNKNQLDFHLAKKKRN